MMISRLSQICCFVLALVMLAGCGFHTLYGSHNNESGSPVALGLNQVSIDSIPNREGQILRNDLIDKMYGKGRPVKPSYTLTVKLRYTEEDIGILVDATSTLTLMNMYGDFDLKDSTGKVVLHGATHSSTRYSKLNDQYATLAAREDGLQRTIDEVSEQIVNTVSLYFSKQEQP